MWAVPSRCTKVPSINNELNILGKNCSIIVSFFESFYELDPNAQLASV